MLDINLIREKPEMIRENYVLRNDPEILKRLAKVIELDKKWRQVKKEADDLRAKRNKISEEINQLKKKGENASDKLEEAGEIPAQLDEVTNREKELENEIRELMLNLPNLIDKRVPKGKDDTENKEIKKWGKKPKFDFKIKSHEELARNLGIMDLEAAAKLTGSGFYVFKNELSILVRALISFFLDFHRKTGRTEIWSPILANTDTAIGTAHLPKFDQDMFKTREGYYLIPTAEMTLTNLHKKEILEEDELPKKYCAYTPCFRTEAGRHGSETPGIFRVHQFDKVEMVTICKPEDNDKELNSMLESAETLLQELNIPYRVIVLCSGDNGFKEAVTYDIETWSPYMEKYMETSSVSTCTDFQARRMNTRYQDKKENKPKFVYTLNGSGLALPRLLIALLENFQEKDGSIRIPSCLWKYTGFKIIKPRKAEKSSK